MIVLIDNYDSFTYNLVQYFQMLHQEVKVFKNDGVDLAQIIALNPSHLVISPGPNSPKESGVSLALIKHFYQSLPILGICLGHQCLAHVFGGKIVTAPQIMHGKTSEIVHHRHGLFRGIPSPFSAMRYHSLIVDVETLPQAFAIDAWAEDVPMAISHREYPLFGLQFHPESILTEHGFTLLNNFCTSSRMVEGYHEQH